MADGRRHSVDIPISKTLVALRRVRSLRDPSTNAMSKFFALVDNVNWETNSSNGISLRFLKGCPDFSPDNNCRLGSNHLGYDGLTEERNNDVDLYHKTRNGLAGNTHLAPVEDKQVQGSDFCGSNQLGMTCISPSTNPLEEVDSRNERIIGTSQAKNMDHTASKHKSQYKSRIKLSCEVGDLVSRVGSPCLSIGDDLLGGSSCSGSLFANENVDVIDCDHCGCGIRCCWSSIPKFRDSNFPSDGEDHPLLSRDVSETVLSAQRRSWKHIENEIVPHVESPRSLSQKFRPKSFSELVGHNVVAGSLLSAISKGRITSFYIFHGPRGTGKTSTSRIFAAALNCLSLEEHKPCGICRECLLFFSGRSRDVKEVDSTRINHRDKLRSLIKNAIIPPVSSRFKVFIVDECQLLREETWATVLSSFDDLSQHVVFIMITSDLNKLPQSAVSRSQRYHFPKINDADITSRLEKICVLEGLEFDQAALDFIAGKSNGSIRDAEMMLDQLSLLGKRITLSLAYELIGIVSDDELLDLLNLALSSDFSNTIKRAREMMRSRIDPMQLISQLANLIMDILAGKCQDGISPIRRKFFGRHTSEVDMQKLSRALNILSETEKQLRMSKNQITWLTVALLQLSSVETNVFDANDSRVCPRVAHQRAGDLSSMSSTGESLKPFVTCICDANKLHDLGIRDSERKLESLWKRATKLCQSRSVRNFLRKKGKLSSIRVNQGVAVAALDFYHPGHVTRAERSWKLIAASLQSVLGCDVEIRIHLVPCTSITKDVKVKRASFSFFSCSRKIKHKSQSPTELGSDQSDSFNFTPENTMIRDKPIESCSSDSLCQVSRICYHRIEAATTTNSGGNAPSIGRTTSSKSLLDIPKEPGVGVDYSKEKGSDCGCIQEPKSHPNCFFGNVRFCKRLESSNHSQIICFRNQPTKQHELFIPSDGPSEAYLSGNDRYIFCSDSNSCNNSIKDEDRL